MLEDANHIQSYDTYTWSSPNFHVSGDNISPTIMESRRSESVPRSKDTMSQSNTYNASPESIDNSRILHKIDPVMYTSPNSVPVSDNPYRYSPSEQFTNYGQNEYKDNNYDRYYTRHSPNDMGHYEYTYTRTDDGSPQKSKGYGYTPTNHVYTDGSRGYGDEYTNRQKRSIPDEDKYNVHDSAYRHMGHSRLDDVPSHQVYPDNYYDGKRSRIDESTPPESQFKDNDKFRSIMTSFPKDSLIDLLSKACHEHSDVLAAVKLLANQLASSRRLMIRSISFQTTNNGLYHVFDKFGTIEDFTIVRDKETNKSKGFGFLTFKNIDSVIAALSTPISLDGRNLIVKLAADSQGEENLNTRPSGATANSRVSQLRTGAGGKKEEYPPRGGRKIYIRNLSDKTTSERLKIFFSQFGPMDDCVVIRDGQTHRSKGYGFVEFKNSEDALQALSVSHIMIDDQLAYLAYANSSGSSSGGDSGGDHRQSQQHVSGSHVSTGIIQTPDTGMRHYRNVDTHNSYSSTIPHTNPQSLPPLIQGGPNSDRSNISLNMSHMSGTSYNASSGIMPSPNTPSQAVYTPSTTSLSSVVSHQFRGGNCKLESGSLPSPPAHESKEGDHDDRVSGSMGRYSSRRYEGLGV